MARRSWSTDEAALVAALGVVALGLRPASETPLMPTTPIDLNHASLAELALLEGIGPARARDLVDRRPFRKLDDLDDIPGFGARTIARLRPHVEVGP